MTTVDPIALSRVCDAWEARREETRFALMLDRAAAATLARLPEVKTVSSLDRFERRAAATKAARTPKVATAIVARPEPREEPKIVRCTCERSSFALQVARAAEYNERRALDAPAWELPDFVIERAADDMAACKATIHFPGLLADTWYGLDVTSSTDDERIEKDAREYEDALAFASSHDPIAERWDAEFDTYESHDAFIRELTEQRRTQLAALLLRLGQNPADPTIVAWVKTRIRAKHGNALRGYCSCIYSLRRRLPAA